MRSRRRSQPSSLSLSISKSDTRAENVFTFIPHASRPFESINEFTSTQSVALKNGQPSSDWVKISGAGPGGIYADYNKWTDVAMEIASRELSNRGATIVDGAPKTLLMSIESATYNVGMVEIKTTIDMRVKTSDGYSAVYIGENASIMAAVPSRQIDGAVMRVVHAMLLDPRIVAFLTQ